MKAEKRTVELYAQGAISILIAAGIVLIGMFTTKSSVLLLGGIVAVELILYFKLISMRAKEKIPDNDSTNKLITWMTFVIFGGASGWLLLVIGKLIEIIYFLIEFIVGLVNA